MKILGGLYTTGGVHTHTLALSRKKDRDSEYLQQNDRQ